MGWVGGGGGGGGSKVKGNKSLHFFSFSLSVLRDTTYTVDMDTSMLSVLMVSFSSPFSPSFFPLLHLFLFTLPLRPFPLFFPPPISNKIKQKAIIYLNAMEEQFQPRTIHRRP